MLIFSRKAGNAVQIGTEIEVRVLAVHGRRVRLGIVCPEHIRIVRTEIMDRPPASGNADAPEASHGMVASTGATGSPAGSADVRTKDDDPTYL